MAGDISDSSAKATPLSAEVRRMRITALTLGGGLFLSTVAVSNERALFTPFDTFAPDAEIAAYAAILRPGGGYGPFGGVPGGGYPGGSRPDRPGAYGARVPGAPPYGFVPGNPIDAVPITGTPGTLSPALPQQASFNPGVPDTPGQGGGFPGVGTPGGGTPGPGAPGTPGTPGTPIPGSPGATSPVPEPDTWLTMILGFFAIGGLLRMAGRRRGSVKDQLVPVDGDGAQLR